jgi:hypothetical protein
VWRAVEQDARREGEQSGCNAGCSRSLEDFELSSCSSASDVLEIVGEQAAAALAAAAARYCGNAQTLLGRLRWRVIRRKIWKGRREATAQAAREAVEAEKQAAAALHKLHPAAPAAEKKAASKAAQAAAAASIKAAAAAASAADRENNSCAESSDRESDDWLQRQQSNAGAEQDSEDSADGAMRYSSVVSTAKMQKSISKLQHGVGSQVLEAMKQRFVAMSGHGDVAAHKSKWERARFSLAAAAAHLQQCGPEAAAAIKSRAERMANIHREVRNAGPWESPREEKVKPVRHEASAAAARVPPSPARTALPVPAAPVQPKHAPVFSPPPPTAPAVLLSATALQFFANVSDAQDVRAMVSEACVFSARHVGVYHKVWAAWEWHVLCVRFQRDLRKSMPHLPEAGAAAAAAAAAALATWPWWMPRLGPTASAFVQRAITGAIPAEITVESAADGRESEKAVSPKKKKKGVRTAPCVTAAAKVVTAQSLAEEAAARILQLPLRHNMRDMMEENVVEHGAALAECASADERAEAAAKAALRAPEMQKEVLSAAAARAQEEASTCRARLQSIQLPPFLQLACSHSTLHSLLSVRDGRALPQQKLPETKALTLPQLQEESLKALLHPQLGVSPHLAPLSFCENSTDPSWLAEAPVSWILALSGAVSDDELQGLHEELVSQWAKFCTEALQSSIPTKVGLADAPRLQPSEWHHRMASIRELRGLPKLDALTVRASVLFGNFRTCL